MERFLPNSKHPSQAKEVRVTCNGIPCTYIVSTDSWFGTFECKVDPEFLNHSDKSLITEAFEIGGYKWQIEIHTNDDDLDLWLISINPNDVRVHASFTVVSQISGKEDLSKGFSGLFGANTTKKNGMLTILMEMRLILSENDIEIVCSTGSDTSITWKLKDLDKGCPAFMYSEPFRTGSHKWELLIRQDRKHMKKMKPRLLLLHRKNSTQERATLGANVCLEIRNHKSELQHRCHKGYFVVNPSSWTFGMQNCLNALELKDEDNGFVKDGWLTVTCHLSLETTNIAEPVPNCIFCLTEKQRAFMVHGSTIHQCVCLTCGKLLEKDLKSKEGLKCPICLDKVDKILYE